MGVVVMYYYTRMMCINEMNQKEEILNVFKNSATKI